MLKLIIPPTIFYFSFLLFGIENLHAQELPDSTKAANLEQLALERAEEKKYTEAIQLQRQAVAIYEKTAHAHKQIQSSLLIGKYFDKLGLVDSAVRHYTSLIPFAVELEGENSPYRATIYHKTGVSHYRVYQYEKAVKAFEKAIDLRQKVLPEYDSDLANSYFNLGFVHAERMDFNKASKYFELSLKIRQHNNSQPHIAACLKQMGIVYFDLGDYEKAITHLNLSLDLFQQLYGSDDFEVGYCYQLLGALEKKQENYPKSITHLKEAIRIFTLTEEKQTLAHSYNELGTVYLAAQQDSVSLFYFQEAAAIFEELFDENHENISKNKNNIGIAFMELEQWENARLFLEEALAGKKAFYKGRPHPSIAATYDNLGNLYSNQKQYKKSLEQYNLAISNLIPRFKAESPYSLPSSDFLPWVNKKTDLLTIFSDKADALYSIYQRDKNPEILAHCLKTYKIADKLIDNMRREFGLEGSKLHWLDKTRPLYEKAVQVALESDNQGQMFFFMEKSKAVLLLESRAERQAKSYAGIPQNLLDQDQNINTKIFLLERRLIAADSAKVKIIADSLLRMRRRQKQFITKLEQLYPKYYSYKYDSKVVPLTEFQFQFLSEGDVALTYLVGTEAVYVLVISPTGIESHRLERPADLPAMVKDFRRAISDRRFLTDSAKVAAEMYKNLGHELYKLFLDEPLKDIPPNLHHLIIIPDGALNFIPFEALLSQDNTDTDFMNLPYLMRDYTIGYSYSASLFVENIRRTLLLWPIQDFMAVAPSYTKSSGLPELPGAKASAEKIAKLYHKPVLLVDAAATKANFLDTAENYKILHLAMHGAAFENEVGNPGLFFHGSDSLLTTDEMHSLNLNAHLVVLSACETGLGEYARGEGVLSMARGFMAAGSASVVMSLWKSNDQATEQIMSKFHEKILEGKNKDTALRLAKLDYILKPADGLGHPYYWAGFVLVGDHHSIKMGFVNTGWWVVVAAFGLIFLIYLFRRR